MAEIAFDTQIGLLRVCINEVVTLRIAKRLKTEREKRRRIQIILIKEDRLREIQSLKALLIGLIT